MYLTILLIPNYVASFGMLAYEATSIKFILVTGTYPVAPNAAYGRSPLPNY